MDAIQELAERAIESGWPFDKFRLELMEQQTPDARAPFASTRGDTKLTSRIVEAAICMTGRLDDVEEKFDERTLQAAHERFPHGISLNQVIMLGAEANGYKSNHSSKVTIDAQRAAFGMITPARIKAAGGFSSLDISNVTAATANKFLMQGWNAIDMTPLKSPRCGR